MSFDTAFTTQIHCVLLIWLLVAWINFLVNWKLRICLSNRVWTGAITEENSRTALPSWLCIYESESWARTWRNEPGCAAVTHGIPPLPDHWYLEISENVITFHKNHSTIFVRVIETFLFKSILNVYNEKNGLYSWKINPTLKEERDVTTKKLKSLNLIDWFSEISRFIPQVVHLFFVPKDHAYKREFKLLHTSVDN